MMLPVLQISLVTSFVLLFASTKKAQAFSISTSVSDLLSIEQYAAQARRAEIERVLMLRNGKDPSPLLEPDYDSIIKARKSDNKKAGKNKPNKAGGGGGGGGGGGFGGSKTSTGKRWSKYAALAVIQNERLLEDGVLRINAALSPKCCAALRDHILQEINDTAALYQESLKNKEPSSEVVRTSFRPEDYYGIEPGRSCRTDLLLSLLPVSVSDAIAELFDSKHGKLRSLFENLVSKEGILYEMAGVVTSPGSARQCVHPDLPFRSIAPLYVVFVALQDVTSSMGPTTFLLQSHTQRARDAFDEMDRSDDMDRLLSTSEIRESTLNAGDLVVFDARIFHCGNANVGGGDGDGASTSSSSRDRALFNFSFRNPLVQGSLGYKGSMRPQYTLQSISLGDVLNIVDAAGGNEKKAATPFAPPFEQYGNGLVR